MGLLMKSSHEVVIAWTEVSEVRESAERLRARRTAEAEARAHVDVLGRATGDLRFGAGSDDGRDALAALEAAAALPEALRALALAEAARIQAARAYDEVADKVRARLGAEFDDEVLRPLIADAWRSLTETRERVLRVHDAAERRAQIVGQHRLDTFWPEFARSTSRDPSQFEDRLARDQREGRL